MNTAIECLGEPRIQSPLRHVQATADNERILFDLSVEKVERDVREGRTPISLMKAGPREKIYFDPSKLKCAVVTAGGLCPGLNNVIRSIVLTLNYSYGVQNVLGIRYGFQGFIPKYY